MGKVPAGAIEDERSLFGLETASERWFMEPIIRLRANAKLVGCVLATSRFM